jgi:thioredoxin-related protein
MNSNLLKPALLLFFLLTSFILKVNGQIIDQKHESIRWMSFTDAVKENEKQPKKIFIDVYTKWCGWCKRMDATTYEDSAVADYINRNYYAVRLDAETHDTIPFHGKQFVFRPEYKANELALSLMSGQMSYPTVIYLDESFSLLGPSAGYQTTEQLLPQLKYFAENIYKNKTWDDYQKEVFPH